MVAWIIADNDQFASRIRESLQHLAIECPATHVAGIDSIGPQADAVAGFNGLVFFAVLRLEPAYLTLLQQIRSVLSEEAKLVVVSSVQDHGTALNAIRAGANDILSADENLHKDLVSFTTRIKSERKQKHVNGRVMSIVPCHAPSDASLMAVNMAAIIAQREGTCGLLDFHLRGGDLALLLKLTARHTLGDLLSQKGNCDEAMFEQSLTPHESGIRLLAGPDAFMELKIVQPQICQQIISLAQRAFPFVIINTEDAQHAEQVRALAGSDDIVLTMRLDVVSLHRTKLLIAFMTHNRVPCDRIHVVALGVGHSGELSAADVKRVLKISSLHCIPDDPATTMRSINLGNPVVCESPHSKIAQAIVALTESLIGPSKCGASPSPKSPLASVKSAAAVALNMLPFCK